MKNLTAFEHRLARIELARAKRARRPLGIFAAFRLIKMESDK